MAKFAIGKHALGICDRCGGTYLLSELRGERVKRKPVNNLVCDECYDPDHPQNMYGEKSPQDAEALRNPRPDTATGRDDPAPQVTLPPAHRA